MRGGSGDDRERRRARRGGDREVRVGGLEGVAARRRRARDGAAAEGEDPVAQRPRTAANAALGRPSRGAGDVTRHRERHGGVVRRDHVAAGVLDRHHRLGRQRCALEDGAGGLLGEDQLGRRTDRHRQRQGGGEAGVRDVGGLQGVAARLVQLAAGEGEDSGGLRRAATAQNRARGSRRDGQVHRGGIGQGDVAVGVGQGQGRLGRPGLAAEGPRRRRR